MQVQCPHCKTKLEVPDEQHYQELVCEKCGGRYQAVTEATQKIGRAFIDEYLKSLEKKPDK
jgi:transcription initiation factor TFIIIB Brf1 subunit/transcription initiation factor TFIIB